jgi:hypothetical protein
MLPELSVMRSEVQTDQARQAAAGRCRFAWNQAYEAGIKLANKSPKARWRVKVADSGPAGVILDARRAVFAGKARDPDGVIEVDLYILHPEIPGPRDDQGEPINEAAEERRARLQESKSRLLSIGTHIDRATAESLKRGDEIVIAGEVRVLLIAPPDDQENLPQLVRIMLKDARAE